MKHIACWFLSCGILSLGFLASDNARAQQDDKGKGSLVTLDGLKSRAPADWAEEKPNSRFRVAQFRLEPVKDDKDKGEIVIFYFGEGGGGTVKENIKRWKDMFIPPEGKRIDDVAKVEEKKFNKLSATYFDVNGTYLFKERPFDPNSRVSRRPNYRMIKVILQTKHGPYYFSLVGPADTAASYKKGFDEWLEGFK
jgi:hypothetical protein